ncbi:hypothetical protein YB2330_006155 [Saitoella coloradoensis]
MGKEQIKRIGIVGAGSMGLNMSLMFRDVGMDVSVVDIVGENVDNAIKLAKEDPDAKQGGSTKGFKEYQPFANSFDENERRVILLSISHGHPTDEVLDNLLPLLKEGDIIIDGGNEWWEETERRQRRCEEVKGVAFIGMGVSGGYQSARRGPSMSPGGSKEAYDIVEDMLKSVAANAEQGGPCVTYVGPRGSGHYVKMLHNGIEQGMLGVISEAYAALHAVLNSGPDPKHRDANQQIGEILANWRDDGELKNNFLVDIGVDICTRRGGDGKSEKEPGEVVDVVEDKVVQDSDNSEGTGVWSLREAAARHVSAPTIAAAHFMRIASSNRPDRLAFVKNGPQIPTPKNAPLEGKERDEFVEDLRKAVYMSFLAAFIQGLGCIANASKDEEWDVKMSEVMRIWRAGCIITSDYIADLLQPIFASQEDLHNLLTHPSIAREVRTNFPSLKRIVAWAIQHDAHCPSISASLEWWKYCGQEELLPTSFMEGEMDLFGGHSYDLKREGNEETEKGKHHTEWRKP